jgi:hypothetical protein
MTNVGMFSEARQKTIIKNLKARIKDLIEINKSHQSMNGRLKRDLNTEKKNHDITREDNQALNLLIKKLEKKLTPNVAR